MGECPHRGEGISVASDAETRDEAVRRSGLMESGQEERYDRITRLAKDVFDVDHAVVNIVDSTTIFTKSQPQGGTFRHTPPEDSFCAITVTQDDLLEVDDAIEDDRFSDRAIVTRHGIRFYAGLPLRTAGGDTIATLCLLDTSPRSLTEEERDTFLRLGEWAEAEIQTDDAKAQQDTGPTTASVADAVDEDAATATSSTDEAVRSPAAPATREEAEAGPLALAALAIPFGLVSGDRGAWVRVGDRLLVTLTDVMGKGEEQGRLAQRIVAALQARAGEPVLDAVREVERELTTSGALDDTFATLFHAVVDIASGTVEFVDAGHGLNLVLASDGATDRLSSHNLPLGLRPDGMPWEAGSFAVAAGDVIVSVSDGALDAYDSTLDSLRMLADELRSAAETARFFDGLTARVSEHVVEDDVTAVVVTVR
jgi:hypothetical protein